MTEFQNPFAKEIWLSTYKDHNDNTVDDTFRRVAKAVASVERTADLRKEWEEKFTDMLSDFKVTAGGRIYANAGTEWGGTTMLNCFVSPHPKDDVDSLEGIMKVLRDQSFTLKSEGGWGHNFSLLRPRGSFIHGIGVESPGAVKYMEIFDKSSDIITAGAGSTSTNVKAKGKIRKGAQMAVLDCFDKHALLLTNKGYQTFEKICNEKDSNLKAITENGEEYFITDWIINPPNQLYEIEDENGNILKVTADHKFMVYNSQTKKEYLKALKNINSEIEMLIRLEED